MTLWHALAFVIVCCGWVFIIGDRKRIKQSNHIRHIARGERK